MDTLYVVMPAYNERDNIEDVVSSWYPVLEGKNPDSRLVVADSGSTDDTHEILVKMQEKYPQLVILVRIISSRQTRTARLFPRSLMLSGSSGTDTRAFSDTAR